MHVICISMYGPTVVNCYVSINICKMCDQVLKAFTRCIHVSPLLLEYGIRTFFVVSYYNHIGITTEDRLFAECQVVCRVLFFGHSAKTPLPSVFFTLGKEALCRVFFLTLGKQALCRVFFFTLDKQACLPSVFFTLGKENFKARFEAVN